MNTRALALGAMIGFVVAIAPSCSPAKCGPVNCDGCCDATSGACVKKPNNGNNSSCGSAGNTCIDCMAANSTCNPTTNTCATTGTGGGTGGGSGGGGGSTCDGCRIPSGTCVPLSTTSTTNCGKDGLRCQACPSGQLCTAGECVIPPAVVTVGSPCTASSECQATLGAAATCRLTVPNGSGAYPGGYCTIECANAACPSGSTCVRGVEQYGETQVCWPNCTQPSTVPGGCRAGYACYGVGATSGACWIYPAPARDAGPPADKVGIACTSDTQCQNPPENGGACLTREYGYNWEANGGYCTRTNCGEDSDCASDGGALCLGITQEESACLQHCADSTVDGGQSNCRDGYICEPYFVNPGDGGASVRSSKGYCVPPEAPIATTVGEGCTTSVDCQIPDGSIADCRPPVLLDGGPSAFTGGYCSRLDCEDDGDCGAAPTDGGTPNRCLFSQQGTTVFSFCYKGCASSTGGVGACRAGYTCDGYGLGDGGRSLDGYCNVACDAPGVGACPQGSTCVPATGYCTLGDGGIL